MKLNLLPTYVSKGSQAKTATVVSVLLALAGIIGAVLLIFVSKGDLKAARENAQANQEAAARAVAVSKQADKVMADAGMIIRNINLADAMIKHNDVYPDLYNDLKPYIPGFFRVMQMSATPSGPDTATVRLVGTIKTFQQYADVMIALYRIPQAISVARSGYVNVDPYVPNLTDVDQNGRPIKPGEGNIPDNKYDRLAYYQAQSAPAGYLGQGGYGSTDHSEARGAMPGYSVVTLDVTLPRKLQTPVPGDTLRMQTATAGTVGTTGGTPAPGGFGAPPGMPGAGPGMPAGPVGGNEER